MYLCPSCWKGGTTLTSLHQVKVYIAFFFFLMVLAVIEKKMMFDWENRLIERLKRWKICVFISLKIVIFWRFTKCCIQTLISGTFKSHLGGWQRFLKAVSRSLYCLFKGEDNCTFFFFLFSECKLAFDFWIVARSSMEALDDGKKKKISDDVSRGL